MEIPSIHFNFTTFSFKGEEVDRTVIGESYGVDRMYLF